MTVDVVAGWSHEELVAFVVALSQRVASLETENDIPAIDALVRLFNNDPWMPPQAA